MQRAGSPLLFGLAIIPRPPHSHPLQSRPVWIRTWHPIFLQDKGTLESFPHFLPRRPKRRAICIWNKIEYRHELTLRAQPALDRLHVRVALARIDRAEKRMLENVIEARERFVLEKIPFP